MCPGRGPQVPEGVDFPRPATLRRRWSGQAGGGFDLRRREMAAGVRIEDVSARRCWATVPGISFFLCWGAQGGDSRDWGSLSATAAGGGAACAGPARGAGLWEKARVHWGVRDTPAPGLFSPGGGRGGVLQDGRAGWGSQADASPRVARAFGPGTRSFT